MISLIVNSVGLLAVVVVSISPILFRRGLTSTLTALISRALHIYLCYRYPIKHSENHTSIPTCPYQWPDGQGDIAKFLEGSENSDGWGKEFGDLYRIWSGITPEVVLTRTEDIQAVFKDSDKHHKAIDNNSGYLMSQILGQCVGLVSGEQWRSVRTVVERAFTRNVSTNYVSLIQQRTESYFNDLQKSSNLPRGLLDPANDLKLLPFLVVAEIIYGKLSPEMERQLRDIAPRREVLFKHVIHGGLARFHISKYLPNTTANRALSTFRADWHAFNKMAYQRAIASNLPAPIVSMFSAVEAGTITHEQLYQTLDEMLYANLDVTLGGISWNVVFLASSPQTQTRLLCEIAVAKGETADEDLPHKYLNSTTTLLSACISESARLRPLAAFSVPQSAPTPRVLSGYVIPAGTNFIVDSHALNIRNPYWGADRHVYRPERFLEPRRGAEMRYQFWRFGFGPRQCMGRYVADLVMRVLLVKLVEEFELGIVAEEKEWERDRETWINHPAMVVKCEERGVGSRIS